MIDTNIILPSKPRVVSEDATKGTYEIEGLYPGYGHTLGNSLRRIILSSLPGTAITAVKIAGVDHEFSTIPGVKEDVVMIILALKKIRFSLPSEEPVKLQLEAKGPGELKAGDIRAGSQVEILNKDLTIATLTDKKASLEIEITVERGLGYVTKELIRGGRNEIGTIFLDAAFTPIRRASYEVENMRVGDQTNYNRLRLHIETDGTITPRQALERAIYIMITQLKAVVGFQEIEETTGGALTGEPGDSNTAKRDKKITEPAKLKIEDLELPARTIKLLTEEGIKTLAGLARKSEEDLLAIAGLGEKSVSEVKEILEAYGLSLKS